MMRKDQIIKKLNENDPLFWQAMIRYYFKKLERSTPKEFKNSPKQLFADEINSRHRYECKKYNLTIDQWLNICSGRLDFIASEHPPERCSYLYQFAIRLGHTHAIPLWHQLYKKSSPDDQRTFIRWDLFTDAASQGYADVVADLLGSPYPDEFQYGKANYAMCQAAENGHAKVVELLLKQKVNYITDAIDLGDALRHSAINGHYDVVAAFLKCRKMNPYFLYEAIESTDTFGKEHRDYSKIIVLLINTIRSRFPEDTYHQKLVKDYIQKIQDSYLSRSTSTLFSEKKNSEPKSEILNTEKGSGVNHFRF